MDTSILLSRLMIFAACTFYQIVFVTWPIGKLGVGLDKTKKGDPSDSCKSIMRLSFYWSCFWMAVDSPWMTRAALNLSPCHFALVDDLSTKKKRLLLTPAPRFLCPTSWSLPDLYARLVHYSKAKLSRRSLGSSAALKGIQKIGKKKNRIFGTYELNCKTSVTSARLRTLTISVGWSETLAAD